MTCSIYLILVLFLSSISLPVFAIQQYHDYSGSTHWQVMHQYPGDFISSLENCEILGNSYLAATGTLMGLSFYESESGRLVEVGSVPLQGAEKAVAFAGPVAYVVSQPHRVIKVLAYSPQNPSAAWTNTLPAEPVDVDRFGSYLVIACGADGLLIYDVTEEFNSPIGVVGQWAGVAHEVKVMGSTALVRTDDGIMAVGLDDPTSPLTLGFLSLPNVLGFEMMSTGTFAFSYGVVFELNTDEPAALTLQRTMAIPAPGSIRSMAETDGGILLMENSSMSFLDLGSGTVTWSGDGVGYDPRHMAVSGGVLGVVSDDSNFHSIAIGDHEYPPSTTPLSIPSYLEGTLISGDFMFGFRGDDVYCYYLGQMAPYQTWTFSNGPGNEIVSALAASGTHVFVGFNTGRVKVLEYSRYVFSVVATFETGGQDVLDLALFAGGLAVLVDMVDGSFDQEELQTYDLADLSAPVLMDSVPCGGSTKMVAEGSSLVLLDSSTVATGVWVIDAADPANLLPGPRLGSALYREISINQGHIYLSSLESLRAVDISNPQAPVLGPALQKPYGVGHLEAQGDAGYMTANDLVYDLSDPLHPMAVGNFSSPFIKGCSQVAVGTGYVIALLGSYLTAMPAHGASAVPVGDEMVPERSPFTLAAVPNPFNPQVSLEFRMETAGKAEVDIYDVRGNRVARLGGFFAQGSQSVTWDGRNDHGRNMPSGVYLAQVRAGQAQALRKVVLVR